MSSQLPPPRPKWSRSLLLHGIVVLFLIFSFKSVNQLEAPAAAPKPTVDAIAISAGAIEKEAKRLQAEENQKRAEEEKRLKLLEKKAQAEEQKLKKLKKEAEQAEKAKQKAEQLRADQEKKRKAEEQATLKLKEAQEKEAKALNKLKAEQEKLKSEKVQETQKIEAEQKAAADKKAAEAAAKQAKEKKSKEEALAEIEEALVREGQKARFENELQRYMALLERSITDHWLKPLGVPQGLKCVVEVRVLPTGEVVSATVVKSSGNVAFDRSSEVAIRKSSPLPLPENPKVFEQFRRFTFTFNPESV